MQKLPKSRHHFAEFVGTSILSPVSLMSTRKHILSLLGCRVSLQNIERATISFSARLDEAFSRLDTLANLISRFEQGEHPGSAGSQLVSTR